jgi:hypothetical protein
MQKAGIVSAKRDPKDYFTNELVAP